MNKPTIVSIVVRGGHADVHRLPEGVQVWIHDYDNYDGEDAADNDEACSVSIYSTPTKPERK